MSWVDHVGRRICDLINFELRLKLNALVDGLEKNWDLEDRLVPTKGGIAIQTNRDFGLGALPIYLLRMIWDYVPGLCRLCVLIYLELCSGALPI